jgi:hypothetical protein
MVNQAKQRSGIQTVVVQLAAMEPNLGVAQ